MRAAISVSIILPVAADANAGDVHIGIAALLVLMIPTVRADFGVKLNET